MADQDRTGFSDFYSSNSLQRTHSSTEARKYVVGFQINDSEMRKWEDARGIPADASQHSEIENNVKVVAQCFQGTEIPASQDEDTVSNTTATVELGDGEPTRVVTKIPENESLSQEEKKKFKCLFGFVQDTGHPLLPIHDSWRGDNSWTEGHPAEVPLDGYIIEGIPADSLRDESGLINIKRGKPITPPENGLEQYASTINDEIFAYFPAESRQFNEDFVNRNPRAYCERRPDQC